MNRAFAALLLAPLALGACKGKQEKAPELQTAAVERRSIVVDAEATGVVEPINIVEVKSKASGMITRMTVETGNQVKPGDLLVQVDTRDVQNQYNQAAADLESALANRQVSVAQQRRSDELFKARVITAQENEAASLQATQAQGQVVRARANLDLAKQRLEDATVTAPVAGTIIEKTVSLGQVITSATGAFGGGTTLLKMADLGRVRVRALFNETDIGQINAGQQATVVVDAYPNRPFSGLVEKIEPQAVVQQGVTLFPVLVNLDNAGGLLKPGMNGEVSVLVTQLDNVLAVPVDAVRNMREAVTTASMLGLNPDSVQAQVQVQMAAMRGGRGNGGAPGAGGDTQRSVTVSQGEVELAPAQGGGQFGGQQVEVTDAQCAAVKAAFAKKPAEQKKLDDLMAKARSGEMDFQVVRTQSQAIYAAVGVDARVAGACRRRERMGAGGAAGTPTGMQGGAPTGARQGARPAGG
ncbi:MAG TPA: efflux RND transporter periplasmic adaptor subunit, partial [Gemmatimonadaceae bacterium]